MPILPVEPHKNPWFIMGEHIPPAFGILTQPSANFLRLTLATTKEKKANELDHVRNVQVAFYLISFLSLAVLASLTINGQQESMQVQKELIDAAFAAICLLGIIAGISPSHCNRLVGHIPIIKTPSDGQIGARRENTNLSLKGHHPDCGNFSSHIIQIGGRTYCAGCTGLVIGATIALVGTFIYALVQSLSPQLVAIIFLSGLVGVTLGLLQYNLFAKRASIHFLLNVIFVVGAFFLSIGVTEINGSLSIGTYFLLVVLFLVYVRSTLSRLEHRKKCITCNVEYCARQES